MFRTAELSQGHQEGPGIVAVAANPCRLVALSMVPDTNTNTNIAGMETLPGTSLPASWAHGGSQRWHPSSPGVTWAIVITRTMPVNSGTRLAPGSEYTVQRAAWQPTNYTAHLGAQAYQHCWVARGQW